MQTLKFILDNKYKLLTWLCNVIVAILGIWDRYDKENKILSSMTQFVLFSVLLLAIGIFQWRQYFLDKIEKDEKLTLERTLEDYKKRLHTLELIKPNVERLFKCNLQDIAKVLDFTPKERISLYIILNNSFALCSRFSENPELAKSGRESYPIDQGIISSAWRQKICFENSMPDYNKNKKAYATFMKNNYNVPKATTHSLFMKSQLFYGYRIHDTNNDNPMGVIIIESLDSLKFQQARLDKALNNGGTNFLYEIINAFKDHIPALHRAKQEEGF